VPNSMRPGDVLAGRYRLVDLMSEARGGRFWYAHDNVLARQVAVHLIPEVDDRAGELMAAARRSAALHDPRLLRVLDADTLDGMCFVVNEWGEGSSLDAMAADRPLSPRRAAWIVAEVGELIATGHAAGVAHGRLVPENVLVDESGTVKVIGFGVDAALHGLPVGTAERDLADLVGVLYAALTARWAGPSPSGVTAAPRDNGHPLRPRQVRAGVPRTLDGLCDEVLCGGPATHGYTTARAVVDALTDFVGDPSVIAEEEVQRHRPPRPAGGRRPGASGVAPPPDDDATRVVPAVEEEHADQAEQDDRAHEQGAHAVQETQLGVPVFYDEIDDVGWATPRGTTPPPPPPFEEPAERPLFAPDAPEGRRPRPAPDPGTHDSSGTGGFWPWGTGGLPPVTEPEEPEEPEQFPGRNWLRIAGILAVSLVLLVALIYAFNRGGDGNPLIGDDPSEPPSPTAEPQAVQVATVADFDPLAEPPEENPELAGNVIDGDRETTWRTSIYRQDLGPGGLKEGVGLLLDLGAEHDVREVVVTLVGAPTELRLLTATGDEAPTSLDQLEPVSEQRAAGATVTLAPAEPATARWVVVWLTALPSVDGGFRGQVAEVVVRA
jgi:hypothetical protein